MTTTIRFGGYQPERSVLTRAACALGEALAVVVPGGVDFQLTAEITRSGRAASDLFTLTEAGDLDACYFASSYLARRVPELSVLDLPFPNADRAAVWQRLDGRVGERLKAAVARRTGYVVLGFWDNGVRHISNGERAIRHPRDCAGLSIRTLDNAFHQAMFAALGFAPRFIDVKDLGMAVMNRKVDAQDNPLTNIVNFDIHKTHRHVSLTGHFFGIALLLANARAVAGWPAPVRDGVLEACRQATALQRELAAREDAECLALLARDGVAVVDNSDIDTAAFRSAVAAVVSRETATLDPALLNAWRTS